MYISSQWPNDMVPQSIKQLDYMLVFKGINSEKLEHIHKLLDLSISFEKFEELYNYATGTDKWSFLYVSARDQKYRKNFNIALTI